MHYLPARDQCFEHGQMFGLRRSCGQRSLDRAQTEPTNPHVECGVRLLSSFMHSRCTSIWTQTGRANPNTNFRTSSEIFLECGTRWTHEEGTTTTSTWCADCLRHKTHCAGQQQLFISSWFRQNWHNSH